MAVSESGARPLVAVTGGTGFVGRHLVRALAEAGYSTRVLLRREPAHPLWQLLKPEIVLGDLADTAALRRLVQGADAVVHLAGAIKARDRESFMRVNRDGTAALARATLEAAPAAHFVQVSSLAAREPLLSGYCDSKAAGEAAAFEILGPSRLSVLRPPAIYGPGDRETLVFFQLASQRLVPLPGPASARIAVMHVADAASAMVQRLTGGASGIVQCLADAHPEGYGWRQILGAAVAAVGNSEPRYFKVPRFAMQGLGLAASGVAGLAGQSAMFNTGKLRELLHEDWSVPPQDLFIGAGGPRFDLQQGFADAAAWYFEQGWLVPKADRSAAMQ